jgi:hypothetical protein
MEVFRKKYNSFKREVVFVLASDDEEWCRQMFSNETDVVLTSNADQKLAAFSAKKQPTFDLVNTTWFLQLLKF